MSTDIDFQVMRVANGGMSFYLNGYRIAGEKPFGGGVWTVQTTARVKDVLVAVDPGLLEAEATISSLRQEVETLKAELASDVKKMAVSLAASMDEITRQDNVKLRQEVETLREALRHIIHAVDERDRPVPAAQTWGLITQTARRALLPKDENGIKHDNRLAATRRT